MPVAGADRLVLTEHIAVMDLMALADCLLLPDDDLALASVLKSPLFGLTEEQLFELAWDRKGSLRDSLARQERRRAFRARSTARSTSWRELRAGCRRSRFSRMCLGALRGPPEIPRPARAGGQRRARRIPQSGARLRDARDAVAAGLPRLAARGAERSQARHGDGARRGAGDDRARRQGAGSQHRHPRRHHHPPTGPRDPRLLPLGDGALVWATARADDVRRHGGGARRGASRRARRIPAAACTWR